MTAINDFLEYAQPHVSGCPAALVKREIVSSAIELCEEGMLWREETDPFPLIKNINLYEIDIPDYNGESDPVQLESLRFNGVDLTSKTTHELDSIRTDWRKAKGDPRFYVQINSHNVVRLDKVPDRTVAQALIASFALKPKRNATSIPDFLYTDWLEPICSGALFRLMRIPNKPWTDHSMSKVHRFDYETMGLSEARIQANKQWGDGSLKAKGNKVVSRNRHY